MIPVLQTFPNESILKTENRDAPYVTDACEASYRWSSGLSQMPIAGNGNGPTLQAGGQPAPGSTTPPATCVFVRLHQPIGQKIVNFRYVRRGQKPVIPAPEPDDDNQVLLDAEVIETTPRVLGDLNTVEYEVYGRYVYGLKRPITGETGFPGVGSAATTVPPEANALGTEHILNGIA